jgi:hypothetical protein
LGAAQLREIDTPPGDVPAFLTAAAATLNDACWVRATQLLENYLGIDAHAAFCAGLPLLRLQGTLSCSVFIDPATERAHAAAFDRRARPPRCHICLPHVFLTPARLPPCCVRTASWARCATAASA